LEFQEQPLDIIDFDDAPTALGGLPGDSPGGQEPPKADDLVERIPHLLRHPLRATGWLISNAVGIVTLILLLAVLAAIPLANFLVLGYLLEVEGRVARSGRFRDAFPLLRLAPRIGSIVLGVVIWIFPLHLLAGATADAQLIDPTSSATGTLRTITNIAAVVIAVHLTLALARGGGFWCFFRPIKNVRGFVGRLRGNPTWQDSAQKVRDFLLGLRLRHFFWLGLRGFAGGMLWLVPPTFLFAAARKTEGGALLVTLVGGVCLVLVLGWVPFLQARFAAENRLRAMIELREIRERFTRAPLAWLAAIFATYVLSFPLYFASVVPPPRDALWLVTPVFIVSIYPAKVLCGWAYHRSSRRTTRCWAGFRWASRTMTALLLSLFVFLLFFTQFIGAHGKGVLFVHHALLLPAPLW
jgi:hypothetical protein